MRFLDTNILLYSISDEPRDERKRDIAIALIDGGEVALSVQVLQEFFVQATRVTRPGRISTDIAARLIETWLRYPVQETSIAILRQALDIGRRHRISHWDAAIVASAIALGCSELLTEDLDSGAVIAGVRIVNPFAGL